MRRHAHRRPTINDTLFETFVAAGSGGGVIVFLFLFLDLIAGQALATPSLAGQVLLEGRNPAEVAGGVDVSAVASMTALHLAAFTLLGLVASKIVRGIERAGVDSPLPAVGALFLLLQVPAYLVSGVVWPELGAQVGQGAILVANLLAAPTMTFVLRAAHSTSTESSESRGGTVGEGVSVPA